MIDFIMTITPIILILLSPLILHYVYYYILYKTSSYRENSYFKTVILRNNDSLGAFGEFLTFRKLESLKRGKIFTNLYIPTIDGKTSEIDLVFVDVSGIYVIESKNISGKLSGDQKYPQWNQYLAGKIYKTQNPINQNSRHIEHLKILFNNTIDSAFYNIVVLSERCTIGKLEYDRSKCRIIKRNNLTQVMKRLIEKNNILFTEEQVEQINNILENYAKQQDSIKVKHVEDIIGKEKGVL